MFVIYLVSNWVLLVIVVARTHAGSIRWVAQGRAGCIAYVGGFLTFMSIGGFPSFVEDMKVDLYFTNFHPQTVDCIIHKFKIKYRG
jgi:hypothetical protein